MKKGHFDGEKLQGTHTTIAGDADGLLNALAPKEWLISVRAGVIERPKNKGQTSLTLKPHSTPDVHKNTLVVRVRTNGTVQELFLEVQDANFPLAVADIVSAAQRKMKGIRIYDKINKEGR